jgi:intracellular multiplication protein IcmL
MESNLSQRGSLKDLNKSKTPGETLNSKTETDLLEPVFLDPEPFEKENQTSPEIKGKKFSFFKKNPKNTTQNQNPPFPNFSEQKSSQQSSQESSQQSSQKSPQSPSKDYSQNYSQQFPHGAALIVDSRNWNRQLADKLLKTTFFLSLLLLLAVLVNIYQFLQRPKPLYFAVTADLKVLEMVPLSEPSLSDQALLNWTSQAVTSALSLDFLHWRQKLSEIRPNFDSKGFESYVRSLETEGHLKKIQTERLILSCVPVQAPIITNSAVVAGVMSWKVQMPILLSYQSSAGVSATQKLLAEIFLERIETHINPRGVIIKQLVFTKNA